MQEVIPLGIEELPNVTTIIQLAEFFQVDQQTIRRAIKSGRLKAFKIGKDWRIYREDVSKYIKTINEK